MFSFYPITWMCKFNSINSSTIIADILHFLFALPYTAKELNSKIIRSKSNKKPISIWGIFCAPLFECFTHKDRYYCSTHLTPLPIYDYIIHEQCVKCTSELATELIFLSEVTVSSVLKHFLY